MVWVPGFLVCSMGSLLLFLLVLVLCLHVHLDNLRYVLLHCQHWCLVLSAWWKLHVSSLVVHSRKIRIALTAMEWFVHLSIY